MDFFFMNYFYTIDDNILHAHELNTDLTIIRMKIRMNIFLDEYERDRCYSAYHILKHKIKVVNNRISREIDC